MAGIPESIKERPTGSGAVRLSGALVPPVRQDEPSKLIVDVCWNYCVHEGNHKGPAAGWFL